MNYQKFESFEEFYNVTIAGVKPEWFEDRFNKFWMKYKAYSNYIYLKAKNIPIQKDEIINYCPEPEDILNIFRCVSPYEISVLILGQDPYPNLSDAIGIAFQAGKNGEYAVSVAMMQKNLIKFGHVKSVEKNLQSYSLSSWVKQGIFLVNTYFTCEEKKSGSHRFEWKGLIEELLKNLGTNYVALLLGDDAKNIRPSIKSDYVVCFCHPAVRDANLFLKKDIFGEVNKHLEKLNREPIDWNMS